MTKYRNVADEPRYNKCYFLFFISLSFLWYEHVRVTLQCITSQNGQKYSKNSQQMLQDFQSMSDHFGTLHALEC